MILNPDRSRRRWVAPAALALLAALGVAGFGSFFVRSQPRTPAATELAAAPGKVEAPSALDKEQREFLWQVEHHGNLLSKHGFGALGEALHRGDAQALAALFAPGFVGHVPREPRAVRVKNH